MAENILKKSKSREYYLILGKVQMVLTFSKSYRTRLRGKVFIVSAPCYLLKSLKQQWERHFNCLPIIQKNKSMSIQSLFREKWKCQCCVSLQSFLQYPLKWNTQYTFNTQTQFSPFKKKNCSISLEIIE